VLSPASPSRGVSRLDNLIHNGQRLAWPPLPLFRLPREGTLFREGDPAELVFEVISGLIRLQRMLPDGRRSIVGFAFPGDVIGLWASGVHAYAAEAITKCEFRSFCRAAVTQLIGLMPPFAAQVRAGITEELRAQQDHMLLLGRKSALERVVTFLLWYVQRTAGAEEVRDDGGCLPFPVPRSDMADYLGITTETVCRIMTALKQAAVIDLPSPQRLGLLQPETLREIAEGRAGALPDPTPARRQLSA
jgi:CRP/FNR family transcriptional regulator